MSALRKTIFVACRELGLTNEARRDLQLRETGKASLKDMDEGDLKRVLNALEEAGVQKGARETA